jgi:hypothetical protein
VAVVHLSHRSPMSLHSSNSNSNLSRHPRNRSLDWLSTGVVGALVHARRRLASLCLLHRPFKWPSCHSHRQRNHSRPSWVTNFPASRAANRRRPRSLPRRHSRRIAAQTSRRSKHSNLASPQFPRCHRCTWRKKRAGTGRRTSLNRIRRSQRGSARRRRAGERIRELPSRVFDIVFRVSQVQT